MGFLGFLGKKKEEGSMQPLAENPSDLKGQLLNNNIPSMDEIPAPPSPEELNEPSQPNNSQEDFEELLNQPVKIDSSKDSFNEFPSDIPETADMPSLNDQEANSDIDFTQDDAFEMPVEEPSQDMDSFDEPSLNLNTKMNVDDNYTESSELPPMEEDDFKVPDFDMEQNNDDFELPDFKEQEKIEEATPIFKNIEIQPEANYFLSLKNCEDIFLKVDDTKAVLEQSINSIQDGDIRRRNWLGNYKIFHDELDNAQEQLMKIDRSLFER